MTRIDGMPHEYSNLTRKFGYGGLLAAPLLLTAFPPAISADDRRIETIDATARGTSINWVRLRA